MGFQPDHQKLLEEVQIRNLDDGAVEVAANRFFTQGYFLFVGQSRSLHPFQCLEAALETEDRVVVVVPRDQLQLFQFRTGMSSKRKASDEPSHPPPRKFFIVEPPL